MTFPDATLWVLRRTLALLQQGWCQGQGAQTEKGKQVPPLHHLAAKWDLHGAVQRARQDLYDYLTERDQVFGPGEVSDLVTASERVFEDLLGERVVPWNDDPARTWKEVLDLVCFAITEEQARIDLMACLVMERLTPEDIDQVLAPFVPGATRKDPRNCPVARYLRKATGWTSIPFQFDTIHHRKEPDEHFKKKEAITWETYRGNRNVAVSTLAWGYFQVDGTVTFRYRHPPHVRAWIERYDVRGGPLSRKLDPGLWKVPIE